MEAMNGLPWLLLWLTLQVCCGGAAPSCPEPNPFPCGNSCCGPGLFCYQDGIEHLELCEPVDAGLL